MFAHFFRSKKIYLNTTHYNIYADNVHTPVKTDILSTKTTFFPIYWFGVPLEWILSQELGKAENHLACIAFQPPSRGKVQPSSRGDVQTGKVLLYVKKIGNLEY